jgi:Flp pilus assembly protein TadG
MRGRGQALVETALVLPVLLLVIGGIVQFGMLFWAQNTLTQIARDTGRWAATQQVSPCESGGAAVVTQADLIAQSSSLLGYSASTWSGAAATYPADPRPTEGVEVAWSEPSETLTPDDCPPVDNSTPWFVTIRVNHTVDIFFPGMGFVCGGAADECYLSSTAQFRMEPAP